MEIDFILSKIITTIKYLAFIFWNFEKKVCLAFSSLDAHFIIQYFCHPFFQLIFILIARLLQHHTYACMRKEENRSKIEVELVTKPVLVVNTFAFGWISPQIPRTIFKIKLSANKAAFLRFHQSFSLLRHWFACFNSYFSASIWRSVHIWI